MDKAAWAKKPERGSFWVMAIGMRFLNIFGYNLALPVGMLVAFYFFITGRTSRRASLDYQRHLYQTQPGVLGRPGLWKAFKHHCHFALNLIDRMWFWQGNLDRFQFTSQGRENLSGERGVLLIGAHIGSFDAMRAFSDERDVAMNVVMYRQNALLINELFRRWNIRSNINILDIDGSDVDSIFEMKERIDRGEIIAILADRPAPYGKPRTSELPFLGAPASFPQNPWILASLLECPVCFTAGVRTGMKRYHIMVKPLVERVVLPRKERVERLQGYLEAYLRELEDICLKHPFQWFNFYDFWAPASKKEERP